MDLATIIDRILLLPPAARAALMAPFTEERYPRGQVLFRADRPEERIYLIRQGLVRAFVDGPDREVTFWFGREGSVILSMGNYLGEKRSYETIETLEPCVLYAVRTEELHRLYANDVHAANWGRRLAEAELKRTEERMIARQFRTASERYADLLRNDPDLLQRVQLRHIASYLGITQVSLSRIRAEIV